MQKEQNTSKTSINLGNIKRIIYSFLFTFPFSLIICLYGLKILFRQSSVLLLMVGGTWIVLGVSAFLIFTYFYDRIYILNKRKIFLEFVFELVCAILLLNLIPFEAPAPVREDLIISPKSSENFEFVELRINNEVQPINTAIITGQVN
jgi:hypothetical protein